MVETTKQYRNNVSLFVGVSYFLRFLLTERFHVMKKRLKTASCRKKRYPNDEEISTAMASNSKFENVAEPQTSICSYNAGSAKK